MHTAVVKQGKIHSIHQRLPKMAAKMSASKPDVEWLKFIEVIGLMLITTAREQIIYSFYMWIHIIFKEGNVETMITEKTCHICLVDHWKNVAALDGFKGLLQLVVRVLYYNHPTIISIPKRETFHRLRHHSTLTKIWIFLLHGVKILSSDWSAKHGVRFLSDSYHFACCGK